MGGGVVGAYYQAQTPSAKSAIGIMVMHAEGDYLKFNACTELSERGFNVLCVNNSFSKNLATSGVDFEQFMIDAGKAVSYLKEQAGIKKVVLLGHSGGGAMLSAYQNIAENGLAACNGVEKIAPCSSEKLANLPKADGIILLDANYGLSTMTLLSLNPAILDENQPQKRDESLSLFKPQNGFSPTGATYTADFTQRFQQGISARMNRLIAQAQRRQAAIAKGEGLYKGNEPMIIADAHYLGMNNRFYSQDPRFLSRTEQEWDLLKADGSKVKQIIHTVRPAKNLKDRDGDFNTSALKTSVNSFLTTFAIRTDEKTFGYNQSGFTGVDWDSTQTSPISAVKGIRVPLLTMGMTGNWEFLAAEKIYQNAASQDKTLVFVEGASHLITPCKECENVAGEFGDTVKTTYDFIGDWLGRFH
ncbi:hypothetical protein A4G20_02820 [Pasteurellaceae bacterium RH1A]|nr:hypothetical protein A4G20_02820 [Pasteurellaceae bacterium RH1A]